MVSSLTRLDPRSWLLLLLGASALACLLPTLRAWRLGVLDPFDPRHGFVLFFVLFYVAKPLYLVFLAPQVVDITRMSFRTDQAFDSAAIQAATMSLVGLLCFHAGMAWRVPMRIAERLPVPAAYPDRRRLTWLFALLGGTALACAAILVARVGGLAWLLTHMNMRRVVASQHSGLLVGILLLKPALVLWIAYRMGPRFFRSPVNLLVLGATLTLLAMTGSRTHLLFVALVVAALWHRFGRPLPVRTVLLLGLAGTALFVLQGMYRGHVNIGWEYVLTGMPGTGPVRHLAWYFAGYEGFLNVVDAVDQGLPHSGGRGWLGVLAWLIPGPVRPDWLVFPSAAEINTLSLLGNVDGQRSVMGVSLLGDLYLELGWAGIVFGMFGIGAVVATLRRYLQVHPGHPGAAALCAVALPVLLRAVVGGVPGLLVETMFTVAPLVAAFWFVTRRGPGFVSLGACAMEQR